MVNNLVSTTKRRSSLWHSAILWFSIACYKHGKFDRISLSGTVYSGHVGFAGAWDIVALAQPLPSCMGVNIDNIIIYIYIQLWLLHEPSCFENKHHYIWLLIAPKHTGGGADRMADGRCKCQAEARSAAAGKGLTGHTRNTWHAACTANCHPLAMHSEGTR